MICQLKMKNDTLYPVDVFSWRFVFKTDLLSTDGRDHLVQQLFKHYACLSL